MKIKLVKIHNLSGIKTSYYSVCYGNSEITLFDEFNSDYRDSNKSLIDEITLRLKSIAHVTGANEFFFNPKKRKHGDNVCYLREAPQAKIRLFCIRYGEKLIILGNGGSKFVDGKLNLKNELLKKENERMAKISTLIDIKIHEGTLEFTPNDMDFKGDLELINE